MPFPAECPQEPSISHRTCKAAHGYSQAWMLQFMSTPPHPPTPAQAELINHTYWAYIPNPPLFQVVEWMEKGPIVLTNDSIHMPSPWSLKGPSHPEEEGKQINISLGYEVLPLCMAQQNYA